MKERVSQTCRFLDSLKSLMEQDVKENDLIKRKLLNQVTITSLRLSVLSTKSEKNIYSLN